MYTVHSTIRVEKGYTNINFHYFCTHWHQLQIQPWWCSNRQAQDGFKSLLKHEVSWLITIPQFYLPIRMTLEHLCIIPSASDYARCEIFLASYNSLLCIHSCFCTQYIKSFCIQSEKVIAFVFKCKIFFTEVQGFDHEKPLPNIEHYSTSKKDFRMSCGTMT